MMLLKIADFFNRQFKFPDQTHLLGQLNGVLLGILKVGLVSQSGNFGMASEGRHLVL